MVGETLGPYRILGKLGEGGMGEVYRARDTRLDRDVAVKILPPGQADSPDARARFEREAKAVAALNHPHILTLFDVGTENGIAYAVTELVEGRTLRDTLNESGAAPARKAIEYALQIAQGLAAAHARGITHRDLKPENAILTTDGQIKILDFGLAKAGGDATAGVAGSQLTALVTRGAGTAPGTVLGTVGYMSPEQVRGQETDPRTDLFSLGAILFELVTGVRAFAEDSAVETMSAILKSDPLEPSSNLKPLPPGIERVVRHALEKQPDERYQTARDFAYDLRALLHSSALSTATASTPALTERVVPPARQRVSWVSLAAGAAVLVTGIALGVFVDRSSRPAPTPPDVGRFAIAAPEQTTFPVGSGAAPWPSLSPDGTRLVFAATSTSGSLMLWMRVIGSVTAQPIAGTEDAGQPFWSPDGRHLAFFTGDKLKKLDLNGGTPQTICDVPGDPRKGTWGTDGVILFATRDEGLFRASSAASGRTPIPMASGSEFSGLRYPSFLPDGRRFVALGVVAKPGVAMEPAKSAIVAGSIDRPGELSVVVRAASEAQYASGHLVYVRDGNLVGQRFDINRVTVTGEPVTLAEGVSFTPESGIAAFSLAPSVMVHAPSVAGVGGRLEWYDRQGHVVSGVASASDVRGFDVSPRGVLAHVHDETTGGDIWRYTLSGESPTRLTYPPAHNVAPLWSPDGTGFVFARANSRQEQSMSVYRRRVDAAAGEELLFGPKNNATPGSWTPDGRFLLVQTLEGASTDVWLVPVTGERTPRPLLATKDAEFGARVSPDGKWLAYASGTRPGDANVFLQAFPEPGSRIQISTGGGAFPIWSHSGHELFYVTRDTGIAAVSIETATSGIVPSTPRLLFRAPMAFGGSLTPFAISPDDQRFLIVSNSSRAARPIVVTTGWTALFSADR